MAFKLKSTLALLLFFVALQTKAQLSYAHGLGSTVFLCQNYLATTFTYSPRLNFLSLGADGGSTLSVGSNVALGYGNGSYGTYVGDGLYLDLPLVLNINRGHAADEDSWSYWGFYGGAGIGMNYTASVNWIDGRKAPINKGFYFNAGIRSYNFGSSFSIHGSYLLNFTKANGNMWGIGVIYNIGDWE